MTTYSVGHSESETGIGWKVFAVFAGFLIPFVIAIGAWLAISAHNASNDAHQAAASAKAAGTSSSMPGMSAPASAAWKSTECAIAPSFVSVTSTLWPCLTWITGPGAVLPNVHAS